MLSGMNPTSQTATQRRRYLALGLGIIALGAAIYFGPMLRDREPDYYDPARTALVNARLLFEGSLGHEQEMVEQLEMAHKELDSAITQLSAVEGLDPAYRKKIDVLRASLESIVTNDREGEISPEKLRQSYRDLLAQMQVLINDMESRGR